MQPHHRGGCPNCPPVRQAHPGRGVVQVPHLRFGSSLQTTLGFHDDVQFAELRHPSAVQPALENQYLSSATFFLCSSRLDPTRGKTKSPAIPATTPTDLDTLFKERMIDWLDLACEQDSFMTATVTETSDVNSNFDLDHPPAIAGL